MRASRATFTVFGAGGLGREVVYAAAQLVDQGYGMRVVDDGRAGQKITPPFRTIEILRRDQVQDNGCWVVAVADPTVRARIVAELTDSGGDFSTLAMGLQLGLPMVDHGCVLMPMSLVSVDATVGRHVIVGSFSSVGHDAIVGDCCTLSSHVDICGCAIVGNGTFLGSGARVLPGVKVGDGCYIGAGAVVVADVPDGMRVFGNPARSITPRRTPSP